MTVLEIRGQTGASRVLVGERIGNIAAHLPGGQAVFITDAKVRRLYPAGFAAATISVHRGLLPARDAERLRALLRSFGLPTSVPFDPDAILDAVRKDKKRAGTGFKFVFLKGIGEPVVEDIPLGELEGHIHDLR